MSDTTMTAAGPVFTVTASCGTVHNVRRFDTSTAAAAWAHGLAANGWAFSITVSRPVDPDVRWLLELQPETIH